MTSRTESEGSGRFVLPGAAEKPTYVKANFDAIARNYDRFNDLVTFGLHRLWKKRTIRESGLIRKTASVLDLCCGSGDLALAWSRNLGPGSRITAMDFSPQMLSVLTARIARNTPNQHIDVREGDAMNLPFESARFDSITIGYGLRNVQDRSVCLKQMFNTLKPGGTLLVLDVGKPPALVAPFFNFYFEKIVPLIGNLIHGSKHEMYNYLPQSAKLYPDPQMMKIELESVGFQNVKIIRFMLGATALHVCHKPGA